MMASNMTASPVALSRRRFLTLVTATAASTALAACSSGSATPAAPAAPATPTTGAPTVPPTTAPSRTVPTVTPPTVVSSTPAPTAPAASVVTGAATTTSGATMPNTLAPDASPRFRAVATRVMAAMAAAKVPGVSLGILADGKEEYATFGVTSIETKTPVAPETLFQIGSLTKTYTGTAMMRLVEQGKVDLDATVRTYLPDLKLADESVAARVTITHLLTHTGGWWGDLFADTGSGDDAIARYVAMKLPTFPQIAPLGQYFSYNNAGFILAGRVIEVVTGKPYRAALADLVLSPLGMTQSFLAERDVLAHPYAVGHGDAKGGGFQVAKPLFLPRNVDPAGGISSTAREQIRYARFHMGDGTANGARVLKPETLQRMQTAQPVELPGQATLRIGLPWLVQQLPGLRLVAHPGDTFGQHTEFVMVPDKGFAFVMLTNAVKGGAASSVALTEALGQYLGAGPAAGTPGALVASPTPASLPPGITLPPEKLAQYAGRYTLPSGTVTLRAENGTIALSAQENTLPDQIKPNIQTEDIPQDARLRFVKDDLALVGDTATAAVPIPFVRKADSSIGWMSVGLRLIPKVG